MLAPLSKYQKYSDKFHVFSIWFLPATMSVSSGKEEWSVKIVFVPCHPPLPPIGKMPPMCNSVNAPTWFCVTDNINTTQTHNVHCGDAILIDLLSRLTWLPLPFVKQMLFGMLFNFIYLSFAICDTNIRVMLLILLLLYLVSPLCTI